jgi:hypothetical protein
VFFVVSSRIGEIREVVFGVSSRIGEIRGYSLL